VKLHGAALAKRDGGDQQLADLIELGMWTGARIEELCALPVANIYDDHFEIEDAKSDAGWRKVPIHSKLAATVARLKEASTDSFLLSGRSPASSVTAVQL
jgi:hypothetical protein